MESVLLFVTGLADRARAVVGLALPIFADAADFRGWPGWLRAVVGVLVLAAAAALLYLIQPHTGLDPYLQYAPAGVRRYFLPLVFVLMVAFAWLAYGLWRLLSAEPEEAEFADIAGDWAEAVRRLAADGLAPADVPLYLVLGRPAAGLDGLFAAAGRKGIIRAPASDRPSVRVYAWDNGPTDAAIFVVCPGASAWAAYCHRLADPSAGPEVGPAAAGPDRTLALGATIDPSGALGADFAEFQELLGKNARGELTPDDRARLKQLSDRAAAAPPNRTPALTDAERAVQLRRLRFLCSLVRRDRRPWCPVNGALVLVPWAASAADDTTRAAGGILGQELAAARAVFRQRFPTVALVTDVEDLAGFKEFRAGFSRDELRGRVGQQLPLVPDVPADRVRELVTKAAQWVGLTIMPGFILRRLDLAAVPSDPRQRDRQQAHNRNLYQLMRAVFDRGPRLGELLALGVPAVGGDDDLAHAPMLRGCYVAGTGRDDATQAFVEGVFQRLMTEQENVGWAPDALAADARLHKLANAVYVVVAVLVLFAAALAAGGLLGSSGRR